MRLRKPLAIALTLAGVGLLTAGVALIYVPGAFITAGVLLGAIGFFAIDVEPGEGDRA